MYINKEDNYLMNMIENNKDNLNWNNFSENLLKTHKIKKTAKQCRERFFNHLNPEINKENWSVKENKKLFELQKIYGNHWNKIGEHLKGRTENNIKNQFFSLVKKFLRKLNKITINKKENNGLILKIKPKAISSILDLKYIPENFNIKYKEEIEYFNKNFENYIEDENIFTENFEKDKILFESLIERLIELNEFVISKKIEDKISKEYSKKTKSISKESSLKSKIYKKKKKLTKLVNYKNTSDEDIIKEDSNSLNKNIDNYFNYFKTPSILKPNQNAPGKNNEIKNVFNFNVTSKIYDNSIFNYNKKDSDKIHSFNFKNNELYLNENYSSVIQKDNKFFKF